MLKKGLDTYRPLAYNTIMTPRQLKEWREGNGLSQRQLTDLLGIDIMTVSRWERGVRSIPPFLHLALECMNKKGGETSRTKGKGTKTKMKRR
jgi:DNA-binding transcriptional regulator YiaG